MDCEAVSLSQRQHKIQSQTPATHYKFSSTNARGCNGPQIFCATLPILTYNLDLTFTKRTTFTKRKGQEFYQIVPLFQLPPPAKALQKKKKVNSKYRCYLYSLRSAYETKLIDEEYSQRDLEVLSFSAVCSIFYKCLLA